MPAIAKTDPKTGATRSLVGHSLDVANAVLAMLTHGVARERLSTAAGLSLTAVHVDRLAVLRCPASATSCLRRCELTSLTTGAKSLLRCCTPCSAIMASRWRIGGSRRVPLILVVSGRRKYPTTRL